VDVIIAIPAFNEATTVRRIVEAARAHAPVLVVDDGSTDVTADEARAGGATVVRHGARRGKGAALATAVHTARAWGAERLVTLDADGQHDPADMAALLAASSATPRAVIVGSRIGEADETLPRGRALAIHVAGFWLNWVAGTGVADTQSGFRVYPLALFDEVRLQGGRFVFETAVLVEAVRRGFTVHEIPIRVVPYAARPSRFHPLSDGIAIAAYLAGGALARWSVELAAGAREVLRIFSRERRVARHTRMLTRAAAHAGSPGWSAAIGVAAVEEIRGRAVSWWHHARARRARRAAVATAAAPLLLVVAGVGALVGGRLPRLVDRVVRRLYDQRGLPSLEADVTSSGETRRTWLPVTSR
jgi:hypothetical protein